MLGYIFRRILMLVPILLGVTIITFSTMHLAPGDPAELILRQRFGGEDPPRQAVEELREEMGLNIPVYVQYGRWLIKLAQGDLGNSLRTGRPVLTELLSRFPATLELALLSTFISLIIAVPVGIISAVKRNSLLDIFSMFGAMLGVSMPNFWLALLLMMFFSLHLGLFPVAGYGEFRYLVLPAFTLGTGMAAMVARLIRSSMLEIISQDYILTARAKGLPYYRVINRHALKNAMIPVVTYVGLQLGWALEGAVIVESIFARPGIGRYLHEAVFARDFPAIQGCVLFFALVFVFSNLIVDISYAYLNPKIRYGRGMK
ncbi:MAG: ABC transporter permease [Candidatus Contubernalis sp.]|nr:ABC transporter permease [Candidatus Contubernalis sp.]